MAQSLSNFIGHFAGNVVALQIHLMIRLGYLFFICTIMFFVVALMNP